MTLKKLQEILSQLKIEVTYNHFSKRTSPPYLVYYIDSTENTCADNIVISENATVLLELYTKLKDVNLEKKLKNLLNNNELPYELVGESFIEDENVYEIIYQINVILE